MTHGLVLADRDFAIFELSFYYFFIYDYKVFHKLAPKLRKAIADAFLKRVFSTRKRNFPGLAALDEFFDNRMQAYFAFRKETEKVGAFVSKASDYISALLTKAIANNGYAYGRLSDVPEIKKNMDSDNYTDLIRQTLMVDSSLALM
jgi:hypothetical protein